VRGLGAVRAGNWEDSLNRLVPTITTSSADGSGDTSCPAPFDVEGVA